MNPVTSGKQGRCPGCKSKLDGILALFKKTRKCEVCLLDYCRSCSYIIKRQVSRRNTTIPINNSTDQIKISDDVENITKSRCTSNTIGKCTCNEITPDGNNLMTLAAPKLEKVVLCFRCELKSDN